MRAAMLAAVVVLVGCTGPNTDIRAVQLNGDTERLPEN